MGEGGRLWQFEVRRRSVLADAAEGLTGGGVVLVRETFLALYILVFKGRHGDGASTAL